MAGPRRISIRAIARRACGATVRRRLRDVALDHPDGVTLEEVLDRRRGPRWISTCDRLWVVNRHATAEECAAMCWALAAEERLNDPTRERARELAAVFEAIPAGLTLSRAAYYWQEHWMSLHLLVEYQAESQIAAAFSAMRLGLVAHYAAQDSSEGAD